MQRVSLLLTLASSSFLPEKEKYSDRSHNRRRKKEDWKPRNIWYPSRYLYSIKKKKKKRCIISRYQGNKGRKINGRWMRPVSMIYAPSREYVAQPRIGVESSLKRMHLYHGVYRSLRHNGITIVNGSIAPIIPRFLTFSNRLSSNADPIRSQLFNRLYGFSPFLSRF